MAGINEFLPFATASGANVMTQQDYQNDNQRLIGQQPGLASSARNNKVLRQTAIWAAAFGELIARGGGNALDNGDVNALVLALEQYVISGTISDASETVKGIIRIATIAEAVAGVSGVTALTPARLPDAITPLIPTLIQNGIGHNKLSGIQGGTLTGADGPEYWHLTYSEYQTAIGATPGTGLPAGVIVMWSGLLNNVPAGFGLCDGLGGRPNLLGKFVRGAASGVNPGGVGGADSMTLTQSHLPAHIHSTVAHTHTMDHGHTGAAHSHTMDHGHTISMSTGSENTSHMHNLGKMMSLETAGRSWSFYSIGPDLSTGTHYLVAGVGAISGLPTASYSEKTTTLANLTLHSHTVSGSVASYYGSSGSASPAVGSYSGSSGSTAPNTSSTGNSTAFSLLPSYFDVAFIIKL